MRPFVCGWVSVCVCASGVRGWVSDWVSASVVLCLVDTKQTTPFARSLSNFTFSCGWWEEELYWFCVTGSKVKVNFGTLYKRPCGQDTDYNSSPITLNVRIQTTIVVQSLSNLTCKCWMMRGGNILILGHGVKDQSQLLHSTYKTLWTQYRLYFESNLFQTSHVSCW